MLKRKIMDVLKKWKNTPKHMSLLLQGARQVGKTTSVSEFARVHYRHFIAINFEENPLYGEIFAGSLEVDDIIAQITLMVPGAVFEPGQTLLFLDEIQSCPKARTALKFLTIDGRFDVIASGSLLGINYTQVPSFPVGYVEHVTMHSLDFEEYLWARGVQPTSMEYIRGFFDRREQVPKAVHEQMMQRLREYIVIGGMPKAVQTFLDTSSFSTVLREQRNILVEYENDIAKYADGTEKAKARACFLSIPKQLARDSKRFSYALVEQGSGARKYAGSLQWLYDAGIVNFCHRLERPELPLEGNADNSKFKVYMRDTGLLVAMFEDGSQKDIMMGDLGIYKGAVYENIVGDILAKNGKPLYYYERNNRLEMDFFIRYKECATAVEVKSSANRKAKSMRSLIENHGVKRGIKLSPGNVGTIGQSVEVLPLYMAIFL